VRRLRAPHDRTHIEPTAAPRDRFAVVELAEQIGSAVRGADSYPLARASVARSWGVTVTIKRMSAAVRQAEADGLIAVKRDGPAKRAACSPALLSRCSACPSPLCQFPPERSRAMDFEPSNNLRARYKPLAADADDDSQLRHDVALKMID